MGDVAWLFGADLSGSTNASRCSTVWELPASERCAFVRVVDDCRSGEALLDYVELVYCRWSTFPLLPLSALFVLCGSLVCVLAGAYVTPALVLLKERFRLSDVKAGATLLTLGNGLPDIMGAVAAVQMGHEGLVVGEVLGGTLFVVGVIVGSLYTVGGKVPLGQGFSIMLGFFCAAVVFVAHIYVTGAVTIYHIAAGASLYVAYYFFIFTMPTHKDGYEPIDDTSQICDSSTTNSGKYLEEDGCYVRIDGDDDGDDEYNNDESLKLSCSSVRFCASSVYESLGSLLSLPFSLLIPSADSGLASGIVACDINQLRFFAYPLLFVCATDVAVVDDIWILLLVLGCVSMLVYRVVCAMLNDDVALTLVTFAGFVLSLCFLHRLTAELVAVVRAMGLCTKLTDEVMGLSILTYGNFVGDISTYVAIVNRGCLQMALTGCISSALMSLLFNITLAFSIRFAMTGIWFCPLTQSPVTTVLMGGVVLCPILLVFSALAFRCHSSVSSGISLICYYAIVMILLVYIQL